MVRILGAGLSGLSCAINLALNGRSVSVFERNASVGLQIHENYQVLQTKGRSVADYLCSLNLNPNFNFFSLDKALFSTSSRDLDLNLLQPVHFVQRGGMDSLEGGLYKQALELGVKFEFNSKAWFSDVDVIATGPKRVDAGAFGAVYEGVDLPRDKFFMMYDDRFSPRGWYFYVIPFAENKVEVVNCVSQPHVPKAKELFYRALEERDVLRKFFEGKKPVSTFAGFGNVAIPRSAVQEGRILTGEAAGFQDPFRGFGMNFAMESGKLAADAIINDKNYDELWRTQFTNQFQLDFSRRFFISVFGSRLVDLMYMNVKSGDTIGFKSGDVKGLLGTTLKSVFYSAEQVKKKIVGHW